MDVCKNKLLTYRTGAGIKCLKTQPHKVCIAVVFPSGLPSFRTTPSMCAEL